MRYVDLASVAFIGSSLLAAPDLLPAQANPASFVEVAGGLALKPSYGVSNPDGFVLTVRAGRYLATHAAIRIQAEFQSFGAGRVLQNYSRPCPLGQVCPMSDGAGAGPIRTLSALTSIQYHAQGDRRGFYVLAGLGPQWLASHPDRAPAVRLAVEAGVGLLLDGTALVEARYLRTLGARAEPQHVVLISIGVRWPPASRVPNPTI